MTIARTRRRSACAARPDSMSTIAKMERVARRTGDDYTRDQFVQYAVNEVSKRLEIKHQRERGDSE